MNRNLKTLGAAIATLALTTTLALAGNGIQISVDKGDLAGRGTIQLAKRASCMVAGTPSEFPNDIWFTNTGAGKLAAGTKIQWNVTSAGQKGVYTLVADLAPSASVHANNVNGGIEAGRDCAAKVL